MELRFKKTPRGGIEQELTQWDQFSTDELQAAEALVRESHQNSLDAARKGAVVRTRVSVRQVEERHAPYFDALFKPLRPHLEHATAQSSAGHRYMPSDLARPRVLVVEDFGTTGLLGLVDDRDDQNFSDFWRRLGRSHKRGGGLGSWGLGKLAFPATSIARTFFGLTVRSEGTPGPYLLGQTILQHHEIDGEKYAPYGFFAEHEADFELPVSDAEVISRFKEAFGITRSDEPGLSIAVPFVSADLQEIEIIPLILRNYAFPILTGKLEVTVGDENLDAATFDEAVARHQKSGAIEPAFAAFIRGAHEAQARQPDLLLEKSWPVAMKSAISEEALIAIRDKFASGKLVYARAPLTLTTKDGIAKPTHIDLFLRLTDEGNAGQAVFVRNSLTVQKEANQHFRVKTAFGALIAADDAAAGFLRDSETPAHNEWNGNAEKLRNRWKSPAKRLKEIRHSLKEFHDLLVQDAERTDLDALAALFGLPDETARREPNKREPFRRPPPENPIPTKPRSFTVVRRSGGFAVRPSAGLREEELPMTVRITAAYNIERGNPFKKHSDFDFDFTSLGKAKGLAIELIGATCKPRSAMELDIEISSAEFDVEITGFDENRDLALNARKVTT